MIKKIKKKRGTKIHVATYAISQTEMIANNVTMDWSMAQTSRLLLSRGEHNSEYTSLRIIAENDDTL